MTKLELLQKIEVLTDTIETCKDLNLLPAYKSLRETYQAKLDTFEAGEEKFDTNAAQSDDAVKLDKLDGEDDVLKTLTCTKCEKECKNAAGLAAHQRSCLVD